MENHLSLFQDTQYITDLNDYFFDADGDKIAVAESIAVEYAVEGTNETVTVPPRELIYAAGSADDPGSQTFAPYWIHPPEDVGGQATKEYSFSTNEENVVRHYPHRTKIGEVVMDESPHGMIFMMATWMLVVRFVQKPGSELLTGSI